MGRYSTESIIRALDRCRRELSGRLTPSAVIERIEDSDGRPGANEAWGIAMAGFDEAETIVTNEEIAQAMAAAKPIMDSGDEIGARMAFRDCYERIVRQAREAGTIPKWYPSLGHDPIRRVDAIKTAADRGLLTHSQASAYLPAPMSAEDHKREAAIVGLLSGKVEPMPDDETFKKGIEKMMAVLNGEKAP
jgi:hypothetical protein